MTVRLRLFLALMLVGCLALAGLGGAAQADSGTFTLEVVAAQLNNPRGLTVARSGAVYVAEAGRGGNDCRTVGQGEESFEECFGTTSSVTRIANGQQRRVVRGLPSGAGADGSFATGAHDVAVTRTGRILVSIGGLGENTLPYRRDAIDDFGQVAGQFGTAMISNDGNRRVIGDLMRFEWNNNADDVPANQGGLESNPYGVAVDSGDRIVTDAGANSLIRLRAGSRPRLLATFRGPRVTNPFTGEPMRAQSVPTSVTVGPDGAYYVGELTGFPFEKGSARVWRVVPGRAPEVFARGFSAITGVAFDSSGNLLVLEMARDGLLAAETGGSPVGRLVRVNSDGSHTTLAAKGLTLPGGLAVSRGGTIYISNNSTSPGDGSVVKLNR